MMGIHTFLGFSFILLACARPDPPLIDPPVIAKASYDFSRYVAVGNSLTAGVMNGGLYRASQLASYPNLLAKQLALAGGGTFAEPLFSESQANGSGYLQLLSQKPYKLGLVNEKLAIRTETPVLYTKYEGENQNLGIPGMRMTDINNSEYGSTTGNPFFERLLPLGTAPKTYLDYVQASKPTFFTCWLGYDDVLDFVASGGTKSLSDTVAFATSTKALMSALATTKAQGVVANVPDPTLGSLLVSPAEFKVFRKDFSSYWITTGKREVRLATPNDLILSNTDSIGYLNQSGFPKGFSSNSPLRNQEVLDADEIAQARQAVDAFNAILSAEAKAHTWPLMDANALFKQIKTGFAIDTVRVEADFFKDGQLSTNSIYSLDGLHPNPRGYALIANEYIRVINQTYKTQIPLLKPANFETLKLP